MLHLNEGDIVGLVFEVLQESLKENPWFNPMLLKESVYFNKENGENGMYRKYWKKHDVGTFADKDELASGFYSDARNFVSTTHANKDKQKKIGDIKHKRRYRFMEVYNSLVTNNKIPIAVVKNEPRYSRNYPDLRKETSGGRIIIYNDGTMDVCRLDERMNKLVVITREIIGEDTLIKIMRSAYADENDRADKNAAFRKGEKNNPINFLAKKYKEFVKPLRSLQRDYEENGIKDSYGNYFGPDSDLGDKAEEAYLETEFKKFIVSHNSEMKEFTLDNIYDESSPTPAEIRDCFDKDEREDVIRIYNKHQGLDYNYETGYLTPRKQQEIRRDKFGRVIKEVPKADMSSMGWGDAKSMNTQAIFDELASNNEALGNYSPKNNKKEITAIKQRNGQLVQTLVNQYGNMDVSELSDEELMSQMEILDNVLKYLEPGKSSTKSLEKVKYIMDMEFNNR